MEKNELISDYFDIVAEISSILKEERRKYERDPESSFFDPFSIAIHHFLGQILAFMIIYFSYFPKGEKNNEILKLEVFNHLFLKNVSSDSYNFNLEAMHAILTNEVGIKPTDLPKIFHEKQYLIPIYRMQISSNLKDLIFKKIWVKTQIFPNESFCKNQQASYEKYLTPAFLGEIFELQQHNLQRKTIQQGVFYSPISEIQFTILNLIYKHVSLNISKPPKYNSHEISSCLIAIFTGKFEKSSENEDLVETLFQNFQNIKVLDPACGSGSFLVHFQDFWLKMWQARNKTTSKSILPPNFVGFDVNPLTILIADFRLWIRYYSNFPKYLQICYQSINFMCVDFLVNDSKTLFLNQKYDFILGNPPYIRNRDIKNPNLSKPMKNEEYRNKIRKSFLNLELSHPMEINRFDYYIYFYLHSFEKLAKNGIIGFIVSNSWMSVKFGYTFQSFLCKYMKILTISENLFRSFSSAEINTVITILQKKPKDYPAELLERNLAEFIQWKQPYQTLIVSENIKKMFDILNQSEKFDQDYSIVDSTNFYKIKENSIGKSFITSQKTLFIGPERINQKRIQKTYLGYNWTNYFFKAPPIYYELLLALGKKTIFLQDLVKIRRGITTNCNEYFILTHLHDHQYINGYGDIFELPDDVMDPFLNSPKDLVLPEIHLPEIKTFLFNTPFTKTQLKAKKMTQVLKYIEYGETKKIKVKRGAKRGEKLQGIHNLASFKSKYDKNPDSWYSFKAFSHNESVKSEFSKEKRIIIQKIFNTSYKIALIDSEIIPNNTFYELSVKRPQENSIDLIFSILLSSLTFLSIELQGRTNFGGGALDTATFDIGKIIIIHPNQYSESEQRSILNAANLIAKTKIQNSNIEFQKQVRRNLDEIILTPFKNETTIPQLYELILEIQNQRTQRSKTFK
ncbi:hypothetical protein NEF87_000611 [Candidatus Lokiarchaeum ossiferum]|uniref:site-specific DNA-methyltransferase (adenine-specific) n=1 Tax=Candidatus Lokiarchaeum ossiferum TaxID=2951803 RepID=A0ABY6HP69_9ARCH|nr:hypothetical protein NEF87_000611 [Candidatus Lokiarchaeum sp. B-35]